MAAALAFDGTATSTTIVGTPSTYTFASFAVAAAGGQERLVFVTTIGDSTTTHAGLTVDGQAATQLGTTVFCSDGSLVGAHMSAWRVTGSGGTSISIVLSNGGTGAIFGAGIACFKLSNADTVLATTTAVTNDPVLSVNTVTGGAVAAVLHGYQDTTPSAAWTGLTERFDTFIYTNAVFSGASADIVSGSTPLAISANITPNLTPGSDSDAVAAICVSFNPDADAPEDERTVEKSSMMSMGKFMGN